MFQGGFFVFNFLVLSIAGHLHLVPLLKLNLELKNGQIYFKKLLKIPGFLKR